MEDRRKTPATADAGEEREAARRSIAERIRRSGPRLRRLAPTAIVATLVGAALVPMLIPVVTAGSVAGAAAVVGTTLFGLLRGEGEGVLNGFVSDFIEKLKKESAGELSDDELQQRLEQDLATRLDEDAGLRAEVSTLLQELGGVEVALASATDDVKEALTNGLREVGATLDEFHWMLDEVQRVLAEIQRTQAIQLAVQREQLDLQRESLVKLNILVAERSSSVVVPDTRAASAADGSPPYKGLESFQPEDADYFFGREDLIAELSARLAEAGLLVVVGASGSGKSSVVRAGLIPAIWKGALPGSGDWKVLLLTPGSHPLEELALRLSVECRTSVATLLHDLRADPANLDLTARQLLVERPEGARLVVVVDQFEEVFTLCRDENERHAFVDSLLHAATAESHSTTAILALRADFYARCAAYPALAAVLQDRQAVVGPMTEAELCRAVERPAVRAGARVQPVLLQRILDDVGDEPGALPLLSHALLETWKRRQDGELTLTGYIEAGGVREAIATTAETVFEQELTPQQQTVARGVFLRLIQLGDGPEPTRRRARIDELTTGGAGRSDIEAVLATLAAARLVTLGEDTVEVAHEALIREWPRLRGWLEEDREGLEIHQRLSEAAEEWRRLERDPGALYRGVRLQAAGEWAERDATRLTPDEAEFLEASRVAAQAELEATRRRNRRLRSLAVGLAVFLVLALAAATFAIVQQRRAEEQTRVARAATGRVLAQAADAEVRAGRLQLAMLLALEALRRDAGHEARSALLAAMQSSPSLVRFLPTTTGRADDVAFAGDGRTVAALDAGTGRLTLWRRAGPRWRRQAPGVGGRISAIEFSPDGRRLAVGTEAGATTLLDLGRRSRRVLRNRLASPVIDLAFTPDGQRLAATDADRAVVAEVDSEEARPAFGLEGAPVEAITFIGRGGLAALGTNALHLSDAAGRPTGAPLRLGFGTTAFAARPDGKLAATGAFDGSIVLWDVARAVPLGPRLRGHTVPVASLAFSPDGAQLVSAGADEVIVWDVAARRQVRPAFRGNGADVRAVAFGPGGEVVSGSANGAVALWNVGAPREVDVGERIGALAVSPQGAVAAAGPLGVFLLRRGGTRPEPVAEEPATDVSFDPATGTLAAATARGVALVEPRSGRTVTDGASTASVAYSPAGRTLAAGTSNGRVLLRSARGVDDLRAGRGSVDALAWARDGRVLAAGTDNGDVVVWDVSDRPAVRVRLGARGPVRSVAVTETVVAAATTGEQALLWTHDRRRLPSARGALVGEVALAPGGLLLVGDAAGSISFWNVAAGRPIGTRLRAGDGAVVTLALGSDGSLASGTTDGRVVIWDAAHWWDQQKLRARACDIVGRRLTPAEWNEFLPDEDYRDTCRE